MHDNALHFSLVFSSFREFISQQMFMEVPKQRDVTLRYFATSVQFVKLFHCRTLISFEVECSEALFNELIIQNMHEDNADLSHLGLVSAQKMSIIDLVIPC